MNQKIPLICLTNNPLVLKKLKDVPFISLEYYESIDDLIKNVRDYIHLKHHFYTHPLSGNLLPKQTPFRSIFLQASHENLADFDTSHYTLLTKLQDFVKQQPPTSRFPLPILKDLQFIDCQLVPF